MKNPRLNWATIGSCFILLTVGWLPPSEAGNVTFVRRSTGNWHRLGKTTLIVGMDYWDLNDGVESDIDDGLPSVIAPLADGGDQEVDVEYLPTAAAGTVTAGYSGTMAGTYDYQPVIDHAVVSEYTSDITFDGVDYAPAGIGQRSIHDSDAVEGDLDVLIDGNGVQWIDVTWESDWTSGGMYSGDSGQTDHTTFGSYSANINVYRNNVLVVSIAGTANGVDYIGFDGMSITSSGSVDIDGDWTFGEVGLNNLVGFWAEDGDIISYEIDVYYEFDNGLSYDDYPNSGSGQLISDGIFSWRFALEDSGQLP